MHEVSKPIFWDKNKKNISKCCLLLLVRQVVLGQVLCGRGCSAPVQLILGFYCLRDKSSTASNPRLSQHNFANKLEDNLKKACHCQDVLY